MDDELALPGLFSNTDVSAKTLPDQLKQTWKLRTAELYDMKLT